MTGPEWNPDDAPDDAPEDERGGYEVGYGKPPEHSRFKPGQSGNPKGRPKQLTSLDDILWQRMKAPVTVIENGKRKSITTLDAIVGRLAQKAANGEPRALEFLLKLVTARNAATEERKGERTASDPAADLAALNEILASMGYSPDDLHVPTEGDHGEE